MTSVNRLTQFSPIFPVAELAALSHGRRPLAETVREVAEIGALAEQVGDRAKAAGATKA